MRPIWFFVGLILALMGLIIFATGIFALFNPSPNPKIMDASHPDIWWGGVMLVVGIIYILRNKNIKIE